MAIYDKWRHQIGGEEKALLIASPELIEDLRYGFVLDERRRDGSNTWLLAPEMLICAQNK